MGSSRLFLPELEAVAGQNPLLFEVLTKIQNAVNATQILSGDGSPNTVVSANVGTVYIQRDGPNAQQVLWIKDVGADNNGWRALGSYGSIPPSGTTKFAAIATATTITIYWDGTNGSTQLLIHRADGTDTRASGNQAITKLAPSTTYFIYPYWDERDGSVNFVSTAAGPGTAVPAAVGSPPYAYTTAVANAAQQVAALGAVPLSNGSIQVTTPSSGSAASTVGGSTNTIYPFQ